MVSEQDLKQARATVVEFGGLLEEAMAYERHAFQNDEDVNGGDLVDWFGDWRSRVVGALMALGTYGPREVPRPRLTHPGCTVEDMENDAAALAYALEGVQFAIAHGWEPFIGGAAAAETSAVPAWLRQRLAETENTLGQLNGTDPETVTARVLVVIVDGVVDDVKADCPGVVVLVKEHDDNGDIEPQRKDRNGNAAFLEVWDAEHVPEHVAGDFAALERNEQAKDPGDAQEA